MNEGMELYRDIKSTSKTEESDNSLYRPYHAISGMNRGYSVSDYCISISSVPSMTIDDYLERLK